MSGFLVSLTVTTLLSFAAPVILIGLILGFLLIISYLPSLAIFGSSGTLQILGFLAVFGNGNPLEGVITLGLTLSIAGILLDIFNFYRCQLKL